MDVDLVVVGQRVRAARSRAGLSQRAVQHATGVSQSTLHRLETGVHTTVTLADVDRLAQALGVTLGDLLYGSPVRERVRAAARANDGVGIRTALDEAVTLLELDDRLDAAVPGLRQERLEPEITLPRSGTSEDRGMDVATQVRAAMEIGIAPITDLAEVVEELTGVDVGTVALPVGVSGVCAMDPQRDTAVLLVNSADVADRQRFTLAHELGHLLFGDPSHVHAVRAARTSTEVRCDAFARNLLIPRPGVDSWLKRVCGAAERRLVDERHVALLARHFGVSPEVAGIQLDRMTLRPTAVASLPPGRTLAHRYGWGAQYDGEQLAAARPRVPRRLLDRAIEAFRVGRLGLPALSRLQGQPVAELERTLREAGISARPTVRRANMAALVDRAGGPTLS